MPPSSSPVDHSDENRNQLLGSRQGSNLFRLFSGLSKKTTSSHSSSLRGGRGRGGDKISTAQPLLKQQQQQQEEEASCDVAPSKIGVCSAVKSPFETLHMSFAPSQSQPEGHMQQQQQQQKVSIRRIKPQMTAVEGDGIVSDDRSGGRDDDDDEESDSSGGTTNEKIDSGSDDDDDDDDDERCVIIGSFKEVINPLHHNSLYTHAKDSSDDINHNCYKIKKMNAVEADEPNMIVGSFTEAKNPLHSRHTDNHVVVSSEWDEERAKLIIGRNMKRWYFLKRFREYTSKSPELKDFRLRRQTLREILSTEITYVKGLNACINYFLEPLKTKPKLLSANDHSTIFGNIVSIRDANEYMLRELEAAMEQWPVCNVGAVFVKYAQVFKIYVEYVKKYEAASKLLEGRERKNKKFAEFLALQSELPESNQTLTSYLIMPVQRLPRYRLLLQDLLKRTPIFHVDYKNIEKALSQIEDVTLFLNEEKRKAEDHHQIMMTLVEKLGSRFENIMLHYRQFRRRSMMHVIKFQGDRKVLEGYYHVYMFNDSLFMLPADEKDDDELVENTEVIYFAFAQLVEDENEEISFPAREERNVLYVEGFHRRSQWRWCLTASNTTEREEWESDISLFIIRAHKRIIMAGLVPQSGVERHRVRMSYKVPVQRMKLQKFQAEQKRKREMEENLFSEIRVLETKYEKLWKKLDRKRKSLEETRRQLDEVHNREVSELAELEDMLHNIREYDRKLWIMLAKDMDAFVELFEEQPIIPKSEIQTKREEDDVNQRQYAFEMQPVLDDTGTGTPDNKGIPMEAAESPYFVFDLHMHMFREQQDPLTRPIDRNMPDEDVEHLNPLFRVRPALCSFIFEHEKIPEKYSTSRMHRGYKCIARPPTHIPMSEKYNDRQQYYPSIEDKLHQESTKTVAEPEREPELKYTAQETTEQEGDSVVDMDMTPKTPTDIMVTSIDLGNLPDDVQQLQDLVARLVRENQYIRSGK